MLIMSNSICYYFFFFGIMIYAAIDKWNSPSFEHFGIKGMKWGVRKQPESVGRRRGSKTVNYRKILRRGAIVASVVLAGAGAYYLYKTGGFNSIANLGKKSLDMVSGSTVHAADKIPNTAADISEAIKPQARCCNFNSFAASLEGSGKFKVSLKPGASDKYIGNVGDLMNKALKFPDDRINDTIPANVFRNEEKLSNAILRFAKNQEGACGQVSGKLQGGGGHAFNWKIEGGKVKFFDTYARTFDGHSTSYKPREDASFYCYGRLSGEEGKITRLDGLTVDDLNLDYLKQVFDIKPR